MNRYIALAKLFCGFLFVIGCLGVLGYQAYWAAPAERCERAGRWWLDKERACGIPIQISQITGRPGPVAVKAAAKAPVTAAAAKAR